MASLSTLLVSFAVTGLIFTVATRLTRRSENLLWTFLQHFCGVWFVFSGAVKAVDPIGTAYKMEEYFVEFESTFAGLTNFLKGLAPVFPWLAKSSAGFSITMIVLEIALGVMLIVGWRRKLTAWLFFLIVTFFTLLTGFTYLTGFLPKEANFFDFAQWGPYLASQMRVTDCGCFGDFMKLSPRTSFFKDVALMAPALLFLFRSRWMHQLWTPRVRSWAVGSATLVSLLFCWYNTYWDLPVVDFRPFKKGANIRERKALEAEARGNAEILGWVLKDTVSGQVVTYMEPDVQKPYSYLQKYPPKTTSWKMIDRLQSEPFIEKDGVRVPIKDTKVSDFEVEDGENGEVTDELLEEKGYSLMIVAFHLEGVKRLEVVTRQDTLWAYDTLRVDAEGKKMPSFQLQRRMAEVTSHQDTLKVIDPALDYAFLFRNEVNPIAEAAAKAGWKVYAIASTPDADRAADFRQKVGANYPFYKADDKLLKTITRSNPGLVVLKDGQVVDQLHWRHLPGAEEFVGRYK